MSWKAAPLFSDLKESEPRINLLISALQVCFIIIYLFSFIFLFIYLVLYLFVYLFVYYLIIIYYSFSLDWCIFVLFVVYLFILFI
jgi:hypothetical protein